MVFHRSDFLFKLAWDPLRVELDEYLTRLSRSRYGTADQVTAQKAVRFLQQAVYDNTDISHARHQKRPFITSFTRRIVPNGRIIPLMDKLEQFIGTLATLPDRQKDGNWFIGRDLYDAVRQYIAEYFNMHLNRLFYVFVTRAAAADLVKAREEFDLHASVLDFLLGVLEEMVRHNPVMYLERYVDMYGGQPHDSYFKNPEDYPDFRAFLRDNGSTFALCMGNQLPDYPSSDWYELLRWYYRPRVNAGVIYLRTLFDDLFRTDNRKIDDELKEIYMRIERKFCTEGYEITGGHLGGPGPQWRPAETAFQTIRSDARVYAALEEIPEGFFTGSYIDLFGNANRGDAEAENK